MLRLLNTLFILVLGLFFALPAFSDSNVDVTPRVEQTFCTHWLYTAHDVANGERMDLKDDGFECVSVPHANVITPAETFDPDMFHFVSWYRKHFRPEDAWKDKLVSLNFQGVMTVTDAYLNGKHLATHKAATPHSTWT